ncbi:uncharacterized protein LOC134865247 [Eleginops maclovinus]|uniref:uncharacterized protein LOC134865247 n=1 Tax=Eleginops maclovinus TaxID=56733 RepID=UPI00307FFBCF
MVGREYNAFGTHLKDGIHANKESETTWEKLRRSTNHTENAKETMGYTALYTLLWLLNAFTLPTQALVKLNVSPKITAECGKTVILNCDVSSSQNGLSIRHLEWFQNHTSFCKVDIEGKITYKQPNSSDFHCEYKHRQLSLIFKRLKPLGSGNSKPYTCKIRSNHGALHAATRVELQECCWIVEGVWTNGRPTCTFRNVYPEGDVHWFHGHHNLSDGSVKQSTTKHVDGGGWLTIHSDLEQNHSGVTYNCSLKSAASGRYIASSLVENPELVQQKARTQVLTNQVRSGVRSQRPMWTIFFVSTLLAVTLK